jgi:hypothetical protein
MMEAQVAGRVTIPIHYHSGQEGFFSFPAKKKVVAKGRRWGLTKGYANRAIEYLFDGVSPGLWVDTVNSNIDRYVERYFYPILRHLPPAHWEWRQQKKELTVLGRKLDMRSADRPELIEGFAYRFIMLNEAGIILRDEYLWHNAIQPMMLDFNPDVYVGGTPKGKGLFHELYVKASETPGWKEFRFSSFDNPYLQQEELQELVDDIPPSIQRQEIYAEFMEDAGAVFRNVKACAIAKPAEPIQGQRYFAGIDLAKVKDFTTLIILDATGNQVFMDRFNILDWSVQKIRLAKSVQRYGARVLIDSTGVGDPIFEDLRRMGLDIQGYQFTNESKRQLIQALIMAFDLKQIQIFDDPVLVNECLIFGYEITGSGQIRYSAPEGEKYHDDCVIALALANFVRTAPTVGWLFGGA